MTINSITKPVALSLKLLWSHERGEMCNKTILAAADKPEFSIVQKDGALIDPTVDGYDGTDAYGVHLGQGQVYWAHSVFNPLYIVWPDGTTAEAKSLVIAHLEKSFLIIKQD
ncbi:hypothetical protein [Vibrio europaeus]|uniref:Uncharacterized protein n=1 Tax=Vibrio europaeus TaxID=300876 RepID=A0ABT5GN13_9VIBR|nr:hypothetical protein [Vibrio europaeus]MDC5723098.1 hypothetical protein [Vibrio europaeus]MDC5728055.1 hypothetical protein [Vibrio europaeus]MDC5733358.1 hypothetical protein [Vibrio europaeus]MDC5738603.1 hypothetical protein [Vibrio europaeus]MDC5743835.1 hypothetical protein [Vibrio europaeus]